MYTSSQILRMVGNESIGWRDAIRSYCDIRQRSRAFGGSDGAVCFIQRSSRSRKPITLHEVFYDFRGTGVVRGRGVGHHLGNGPDAPTRVVENLDLGVQRIAALTLHSGVSDVPGNAVSAAGDLSQSGAAGECSDGNPDFHDRNLRNSRGAGRLVALLFQ